VNSPLDRVSGIGRIPLTSITGPDAGLDTDKTFGETLKKFVDDVNDLQVQADESIEKLATGEITDVHQVMLAVDEANTAMEFMLEIRNKIVDAYQEIMRMQV
jgi:flagellar hook-basal body complex protein FliE